MEKSVLRKLLLRYHALKENDFDVEETQEWIRDIVYILEKELGIE